MVMIIEKRKGIKNIFAVVGKMGGFLGFSSLNLSIFTSNKVNNYNG